MTLKLKVHSELATLLCRSYISAVSLCMNLTGSKCRYTKVVRQKESAVGLLACDRHHLFIWIQPGRQRYRECKHNPCQFRSSASILSIRLCFILRQTAVLPTKLFWDDDAHNRAACSVSWKNQSRLNSMLRLTKVSVLMWNAYEPMWACAYGGFSNGHVLRL